jgi:hypothetical protein
VKDTLEIMNDCFSTLYFLHIADSLLWFSSYFFRNFQPELNNIARIVILIYMTCDAYYLLLAAKGSKMLERIGDYVYTKHEDLDDKANVRVMLLLQDISRNPLALKAHEFRVDYKFVVSSFSTVLTYAFVLFQFEFMTKCD